MSQPESPSRVRQSRHARGAAPTLHDVAREAGVSLATASRVLNGSERKVAESFRERVEQAAAELGYTANVSAQATARGTSPVIALLVADIADPYFGLIAAGVARGADEQGLVVTIAITERDPAREARIVRALRGQRPQGLILAASRTKEPTDSDSDTARELAEYARFGGRVVTFGAGSAENRHVEIDNRAGAEELGRRMAALGYRSAIAIAAAEGVLTSDERLAGFRAGFESGGGAIDRVLRGDFRRESGVQAMTAALAEGVVPGTLVFGMSDVVAIGAMSAIRDAGREIGADIAVCGFDDVPSSSDVTPALTTVRVPLSEVGYQAFRATVDADWEQAALPLEVTVRASTPGIPR
ncbi:LacI family DNA-binding transcriptional regulator [Microbacterium phyllosphaerae]|uniref:LacI family DNA-binding transcriptional regulator n=1 Tax=Microbacterium phyllosphaerae TaxID=124798 RepID=UPI00216711CF|nr:LacI family DNA-binding transcriptional regulator [Microbacterium phyllosphaerae]MCS3444622.1 LacI family transcriptional regulator [Microbacterium phyllosphaerae]